MRIGDNPLTIALGDGPVLFDALGVEPAALYARSGRADLVLRFERNSLCCEATMIDARIDIELGKALVDVFGPALAPLLDQFGAVPVAHLRAEAININLAQRQHHVRRSEEHTSELQSLMRISY